MDAPPEVQDEVMQMLEQDYQDKLPELLNIYSQLNPDKGKALQHFLGLGNAKYYVEQLVKTGDADLAQEALNKRLGNKYANLSVQDYLSTFVSNLR